MNIFKRCTQQPPEPSLWEDDVTVDNILSKLLIYFGGFQCLIEAKKDIETKCEMEKKENYWSESDIKKAWRERERMNKKKKSAIKHWSRVIVLEELKRRLYDDKCKRQAEADVKEDEKTQACGNAPRKIGKTDEISFNTEPSIVSEERQIDNDCEKTWNNKEQVKIHLVEALSKPNENPHLPCIFIPLSVMSGDVILFKTEDRQTVESPYKLINGCPGLTNGDKENDIRKRKSFVMSYNNKTNNANWVYEILNKSTLANNFQDVKYDFDLPDKIQKGHLAAAANHRWCFEAHEDASLFNNMVPQIRSLNQGMWRSLEEGCRSAALDPLIRNLHVYTGPCYSSGNYEDRVFIKGKALPTHFFKVIIVEDVRGVVYNPKCYLIPNMTLQTIQKNIRYFECDISVIEMKSGLTFLKREPSMEQTPCRLGIRWLGNKWEKMGKMGNDESHAYIEIRIYS